MRTNNVAVRMYEKAMRGPDVISKIVNTIKIKVIDTLNWINFLIIYIGIQTSRSSLTTKKLSSTPVNSSHDLLIA